MVPLCLYGLERASGARVLDPRTWSVLSFRGTNLSVLVLALGTAGAALLALRWIRFPFLIVPWTLALWTATLDGARLLLGSYNIFQEARVVSVLFGLILLVAGFVLDRRTEEDFSFWLYLVGLAAFWTAPSFLNAGNELYRAIWAVLNLGLIAMGTLLRRRAFIAFGGVGVFMYLGYLSARVFEGSRLFPFALTLVGLAVIYAGVKYEKRRTAIEVRLQRMVPPRFRHLFPQVHA